MNYVTRYFTSLLQVDAGHWNGLLAQQPEATPFLRHEYLVALLQSDSACTTTGWQAHCITLWQGEQLQAACVVYLKAHSYGEYVFDWAWAEAYGRHGLVYYPKALVAVPFTPVPGTRLLARNEAARHALLKVVLQWCEAQKLSSLHLLFCSDADVAVCTSEKMMLRHTVQFHWQNDAYRDFDHFLASLSQEKRKKIKQERRKVVDAGVSFRWVLGSDICAADWDFFYRCYAQTYLEHGNAPYLSRDFFHRIATTQPANWLLFIAQRNGQPIASSLIAVTAHPANAANPSAANVAYGRYWGALERVDCLHFEACYYQPLKWCIDHAYQRFEGGAQGEHKMARALLPVKTTSAHWLAHPAFADAVERFLAREGEGVENYMAHLEQRNPFKQASHCPDAN